MALTKNLPNFKLSEFRHPELIEPEAAGFLQSVRTLYGKPLTVTSDGRTPESNAAAGGSPLSWHVKGRAFDLRWPGDATEAWELLEAFFTAVAFARAEKCRNSSLAIPPTFELELVYSKRDRHVHFAIKDNGSPSRLVLALD